MALPGCFNDKTADALFLILSDHHNIQEILFSNTRQLTYKRQVKHMVLYHKEVPPQPGLSILGMTKHRVCDNPIGSIIKIEFLLSKALKRELRSFSSNLEVWQGDSTWQLNQKWSNQKSRIRHGRNIKHKTVYLHNKFTRLDLGLMTGLFIYYNFFILCRDRDHRKSVLVWLFSLRSATDWRKGNGTTQIKALTLRDQHQFYRSNFLVNCQDETPSRWRTVLILRRIGSWLPKDVPSVFFQTRISFFVQDWNNKRVNMNTIFIRLWPQEILGNWSYAQWFFIWNFYITNKIILLVTKPPRLPDGRLSDSKVEVNK